MDDNKQREYKPLRRLQAFEDYLTNYVDDNNDINDDIFLDVDGVQNINKITVPVQ